MSAPSKRISLKPPAKGSFPFDRYGECKKLVDEYMDCLTKNKSNIESCRELSQEYLKCRMEKNLMAEEKWENLGFEEILQKSAVKRQLEELDLCHLQANKKQALLVLPQTTDTVNKPEFFKGTSRKSCGPSLPDYHSKDLSNEKVLLKQASPYMKLPDRYKRLFKIFKAMESTVLFHKIRSADSQIIFHKILPALENAADTGISPKDVAIIVAIDESLFNIQPSRLCKDGQVVYTFRFSWNEDEFKDVKVEDVMKNRLRDFQKKLVEICKEHYAKFKAQNKIKDETGDKYPVEFMKSGPPFKYSHIVLDYCKKPVVVYDKEAIKSLIKRKPAAEAENSSESAKGMSVLERIKLKEKRRKEHEALKLKQATAKELSIASQLCQIASVLDASFTLEKKNVFYIQQAVGLLMEGMKTPMSTDECESALKEMVKVVPEWISLNSNEFGTLVSLDQSVSRNDVMTKLKNHLSEMKKSILYYKADIAKKILDGDESVSWGLFKYDKSLLCTASGPGSVDELKSNLKDDAVLFGYIRVQLGSDKRKKYAFLKWVGDDVRPILRARAFDECKKVMETIKVYHIEVPVARKSDLTEQYLTDRIKSAAGANYDKEQNTNAEVIQQSSHEFGNYKRTSKEFFKNMEQKGNVSKVIYDAKPMARTTPVDLGNRQMTAGASAARANTVDLQTKKESEQKV